SGRSEAARRGRRRSGRHRASGAAATVRSSASTAPAAGGTRAAPTPHLEILATTVTIETVVASVVRRLDERLPREVYVLQTGLLLNAFGNGAANPFVLLYLHDVRHIPLAQAGLASAANAGAALVASLAGGSIADRFGPKASVLVGLGVATGTFAAYPTVTTG